MDRLAAVGITALVLGDQLRGSRNALVRVRYNRLADRIIAWFRGLQDRVRVSAFREQSRTANYFTPERMARYIVPEHLRPRGLNFGFGAA